MLKDANKSVAGTLLWGSLRALVNVTIVFLLVEGFLSSYQFSYQVFGDYPYAAGNATPMTITIEEGQSASDIADILYENRVVEGKYLFLARVYLGKYANRMQAGSHQVSAAMSPNEICKELCGIKSEASS